MDLIQAIALLCQISSGSINYENIQKEQMWCQQTYLHCVNLKTITISKDEALNKCIMEKK